MIKFAQTKIFVFIFLSIFFTTKSFAQDTKTPEQIAAEQRLPEGAKQPEYIIRKPEGGKVANPKIEPSSWWIGMKNSEVEILIHDENIKGGVVKINYKGVKVTKTDALESPNYLFVTLNIKESTEAGNVPITVVNAGKSRTYILKLNVRDKNRTYAQGLNTSDFVYLLMPDRFANGDPSNDSYNDMSQRGIDRSKMYFRHGGDIQGMINHLDYLQELGVTTVWANPLDENNQPYESYHGYAITDHYQIDKRFGTNELFKTFVDKTHEKGMKVMKDIIFNHVGLAHYTVQDIPSSDWIHQWPEFTRSNYRYQTHFDPYASEADKKQMVDGWFDYQMPDLNQKNPKLATYLTQNTIWWIEYAGLDAYRVDTWPYNDLTFMDKWSAAIFKEYPNFYICGESWVDGVTNQAYFAKKVSTGFFKKDNSVSAIDFQFQFAISDALNKNEEWTGGVNRIFHTLSNDYLFNDAYKNLTFLDNHDMTRIFSQLGENKEKLRSATAFLLTCRGIPQTYYGTEILMKGVSNPDGYVRFDFPGGWAGDKADKFKASGRTDDENAMFNFTKTLANYRKNSTALTTGKMTQFIPRDGVYTYFRYDEKNTVMVMMNTRDKATEKIDIMRFTERISGFTKGKNILTGEFIELTNLKLLPYQTLVVELVK